MARKHVRRLKMFIGIAISLWLLRGCFWNVVQEQQARMAYSWAIGKTPGEVHNHLKGDELVEIGPESYLKRFFATENVRYAIDAGDVIAFWEGNLVVGFVEDSSGKITDLKVKTRRTWL